MELKTPDYFGLIKCTTQYCVSQFLIFSVYQYSLDSCGSIILKELSTKQWHVFPLKWKYTMYIWNNRHQHLLFPQYLCLWSKNNTFFLDIGIDFFYKKLFDNYWAYSNSFLCTVYFTRLCRSTNTQQNKFYSNAHTELYILKNFRFLVDFRFLYHIEPYGYKSQPRQQMANLWLF